MPLSRTTAVVTVVILGSLMPVLDMTIVNVALNHLSRDFGVPLATIQWVVTGYTLALAAVIPVTAWAIGRFGGKRVYLTALALFVLGSALAGASWSAGSLIGFRILQGLGGGMIVPTGMALVMRAADKQRYGRTMSLLGLPVLVGPLAGPVLGGWLVDDVSWRWMFYLNIPVGVLALMLASRFLPAGEPRESRPLDLPGLLMLSPGLAALLYGLTGSETGSAGAGGTSGFAAPGTYLPTAAGAVLVTGFVVRALTTAHPLIDLRLFRHRSFAVSAAALALFTCGYFGSMLLTPMYYQVVRGQSALGSGLLGLPQVLASGITMQVAGHFTDKVSPRRLILPGILLAASGLAVFTLQLGAQTPYWRLMSPLAVMGVGVGMTMMPSMTAATRGLPSAQAPGASTALNISQQVWTSVGTAVLSLLLAAQITARIQGSDGSPSAVPQHPPFTGQLADAFQYAYAWAAALMLAAAVPALFHSRRPPLEGTATPVRAAAPVSGKTLEPAD